MAIRDYTANVISATPVVPDGAFQDSAASGVWDINEALDLIKGSNWPTTGNFNPAAFVDNLFQTHLYNGTGSEQTITNGIDLSGKGGLVWIKLRTTTTSFTFDNHLFDTERGALKRIRSNRTNTESTYSNSLTSFNSNGFTLGSDPSSGNVNYGTGTNTYVSWTFRKQPKFFDVVTYSGNGTAGRQISHNLGTTVGAIFIKSLNNTRKWCVYHRGTDASNPSHYKMHLNATDARANEIGCWNDTEPTSTVFTVGNDGEVNASGENYVAYLFAHNNNDGGFGEPGDQDIIKCGSYTGNGNATGPVVTLGFEPQLIMIKRASGGTGDWDVYDNMRGIPDGAGEERLEWNTSDAESTAGADRINLSSTGFSIATTNSNVNTNGDTYVYMAIRRGGMQTPTAATNVFAIDTMANQTPAFDSTFPVDMVIRRNIGGVNTNTLWTRLTGQKYMNTNATDVESNDPETFDSNVGFGDGSTYSDNHAYMWARARGYFDVVTYTGNSTNNHEIKHNLGVAPEMVWTKQRTTDARSWVVYHSALGNTNTLALDTNGQADDESSGMHANPTASSIFLKAVNSTNASNQDYIAHFFATVAGVSKVGSFTQSGATNVACGFTGSTPALIILKRTDASGDWYLFDSLRGIVAGNDPYFILNDTTAPTTNADMVDPYSGGFATTSNIADGSYIFYAIAAIS